MKFDAKMELLKPEYDDLSKKIIDPKQMSDQRKFSKISKRYNELLTIFQTYEKIQDTLDALEETEELLKDSDADIRELAQDELQQLQSKEEKLSETLKDLLAPKDPNDKKNAIIEIRAGTGGDEAALFVADLYRMYTYFSERMNWKKSMISASPTGIGGYKEIVFELEGNNVFGNMRFESGVHRVQRVPETESSGRVHTSAISVAVMPEAEEIDIEISNNDLRIDVFRSSGNGGQSVNTTDSAVRITHQPSGIVVTCQDEKSQLKNKVKAMKVLRSRLLDAEIAKQESERSQNRKLQVGTGDRSGKIRTYNFPQSRVTDHRINLTTYKLDKILSGEIEEYIEALKMAYKNEKVENL
ncbi:MAG: peptide chain release factor 1 [Candidatus Cloacimonadota bacterium]|nr:peptide chain release factor 1 [Candidatus Cloacimonadota bacterium]